VQVEARIHRRRRGAAERGQLITFSLSRKTARWAAAGVLSAGFVCFVLGYAAGRSVRPEPRLVARTEPVLERLDEAVKSPPKAVLHEPQVDLQPEVEAARPAPIPIRDDPDPGRYGVQLGAFRDLAEAKSFVETNRAQVAELPVFILPASIPGRGTWYRVRIGEVSSQESAEAIRDALPADLARNALIVAYR